MKLGNLSEKEKENALNEVRILASVKHRNIVGYKEAFIDHQSNSLWYQLFWTIVLLWSSPITGICTRRSWNIKRKAHWCLRIEFGRYLSRFPDLVNYDLDRERIETVARFEHLPPGSEECQRVHELRWLCTVGGYECLEGGKRRYVIHPNRDTLLCLPRSLEGLTLWLKIRYLVTWMRAVWDDYIEAVSNTVFSVRRPFRAEDMEGLYKKVVKGSYPKISQTFS